MKKANFFFIISLYFIAIVAPADIIESSTVPQNNPHPPHTAIDKQRVAFAELAIKQILANQALYQSLLNKPIHSNFLKYHNKDHACINNQSCLLADVDFTTSIKSIFTRMGYLVEMRHAHIIPWSMEQFKNNGLQNNGNTSNQDKLKTKLTMPGDTQTPRLKKDEYMVHVYAKFSKSSEWHHLDVILSEDTKGKISLRYFFAIPIPKHENDLPPGVKC